MPSRLGAANYGLDKRTMNYPFFPTRLLLRLVPLSLLLSTINHPLSTFAQGSAFTYQGRLNASGQPANGLYDLRLRLASDALGSNYVGGILATNGVPVSNGLFTVTIDFGAGPFTGSNLWLQVEVRTNSAGAYTVLSPLQQLTPAPYAIQAANATLATSLLQRQSNFTCPRNCLLGSSLVAAV